MKNKWYYLGIIFIFFIAITSCNKKSDYYRICLNEDNIIIRNNEGSIAFPIIGEVSIDGNVTEGGGDSRNPLDNG